MQTSAGTHLGLDLRGGARVALRRALLGETILQLAIELWAKVGDGMKR